MIRTLLLTLMRGSRFNKNTHQPITSTVLPARNMAQSYADKLKKKQMEEIGRKEFFKKNRQFAAANYKEWRYPRGLNNRAVDASCTIHIYDKEIKEEQNLAQKLRQPKKELQEKLTNIRFNRMIKKHVPSFHTKRFPAEAQDIYVKTHNLLNTENWTMSKKDNTTTQLYDLVTEHAYPEMTQGLKGKTLHWEMIESLEPPRVTSMLVAPMIEKENLFAQVTVRFHTKQILAVYDRYGRLLYGSPERPRSVLDYVVFERHLVNRYGQWRIHGKVPNEIYEREPLAQTKAVLEPHLVAAEAREWREEEKKVHPYVYYPQRKIILEIQEKLKRTARGQRYHRRMAKKRALTKKYAPILRFRSKVGHKVTLKKEKVLKMREEGKLPYPPKERDV